MDLLTQCVNLTRSPVTRIVRVIGQPRGNMLLVGIGGSGRQSLARLASSICEYNTFQIEVTKHYRKQEFRDGMAGILNVGRGFRMKEAA